MIAKTSLGRMWSDARAKITEEGRCRVCGTPSELEAAHVIGQKCDATLTGPRGGEYKYVHPDSVVPLCSDHHRQYDARKLDLLPFLLWPEQHRATEDAQGIINALKRVSPMGGTW